MAVPAKLAFSMGFKKFKKFLKNFNVFVCPQGGLKLPKIVIFLENGLFFVIIIF